MKYRVIKAGLFGAAGAVPLGTEFSTNEPLPEGMSGFVEKVGKEPAADAVAVTNPEAKTKAVAEAKAKK